MRVAALVLVTLAFLTGHGVVSGLPAVAQPEVLAVLPHDPDLYTQGLAFASGLLYESAGRYGHSRLVVRAPRDSTPLATVTLPPHVFAEGLALFGEALYLFTWREGEVYVFDRAHLRLRKIERLPGEVWGATSDGSQLIVSDGSATLRFLDPVTLREQRRLRVRSQGRELDRLNELEYVEGEILANIYGDDRIARIDAKSGEVVGFVTLADLRPDDLPFDAVSNGIAWDGAGRLDVTGKYWPVLYVLAWPP